MTQTKDEAEEARIIALRAERVRIAARERDARLAQQAAQQTEAAEVPVQASEPAAQFLRSVPASPAAKMAAQEARPVQDASPAATFLRSAPAAPKRASDDPPSRSGDNWIKRNRLFLAMVVLPMIIVAYYLIAVATPLYEARSVIAITRSSDAGEGASAGLLGNVEDAAGLQEVFRASSFIHSQALMDALENEFGFITELSGPSIDPVRRLRSIPLLSIGPQDQFHRFVEASIDVQSGLLTLYVRSPEPQQAVDVSNAVLAYADNRVAALAQSLFDTRQSYAAEMRAAAEAQVQQAQARLVALQVEHQDVDPKNRVETIYARIQELETESQRLKNDIQKTEIEGFGDSPQTQKMRALEAALQEEIQRERAQLVSSDGTSDTPLNNLLMEYEMALLEVDLARQAVKTAIEAEAEAGREAALHRSHLQVIVPPGTAAAPVFPKVPGILAFFLVVFLAAYAAVRGLVRPKT